MVNKRTISFVRAIGNEGTATPDIGQFLPPKSCGFVACWGFQEEPTMTLQTIASQDQRDTQAVIPIRAHGHA